MAGIVGAAFIQLGSPFGLIVANRSAAAVAPTLVVMDGYAWLAQAIMFLLLGLLVTPSQLAVNWLPSLAVAVVLMVEARPVAVWVCLWPFRFSARET